MLISRITNQGLARLATKWPYLSDRLTTSFDPLESKEIPWSEVSKPLNQSKIAVVTTAGVHHRSQPKFNMTDRHGDPSFRILDAATIEHDYTMYSHGLA